MDDPVSQTTSDLKVWLVRPPSGGATSLRDDIISSASRAGVEILVVRGDMVFGSDHLRSALYHAKKAMSEGRNASDSLAMETLLYASGERQLGTAIRKMSVDQQCEEIVVAQLTPGTLDIQDPWSPLGPVRPDVSEQLLTRYGVSTKDLGTVSPAKRIDLVLERVASVDVLKK